MKHNSFLARQARHYVERIIRLSYVELAFWYAIMILGCSALYTLLFNIAPEHAPTLTGGTKVAEFFEALYFSVITATSVGYGDIIPQGISKIFAALEAVLGLSLFAILVSKPISERQERTLSRTHKLTLDGMLTTIREGFFIMRKDFDDMMKEANSNTLSENTMANLAVALEQGQILMEDIPTFYDVDRSISGLDERRELLLAESVDRTFIRLIATLETLDQHSLEWRGKREVVQALDELLMVAKKVIPKWEVGTSAAATSKISSMKTSVERLEKILHG